MTVKFPVWRALLEVVVMLIGGVFILAWSITSVQMWHYLYSHWPSFPDIRSPSPMGEWFLGTLFGVCGMIIVVNGVRQLIKYSTDAQTSVPN